MRVHEDNGCQNFRRFWKVYHILKLPVVIDLAIGNNRNMEDVFSAGPGSKYFMSPNTMDANNPSRRGRLCGASCDRNTQVEVAKPADSSTRTTA